MKIATIIKVVRYLQAALTALPTALVLISKIRAAFGNEQVKEVIKALGEFIDKIAPPAPTADSGGSAPANPDAEKRRRWFRFRERINVAKTLTDTEAHEFCVHHVNQSGVRHRT